MPWERDRPIRVLLVEDSPSDAALLQADLLGVEGGRAAVTVAETMAEAIERAREQPFDAVLLDLTLPDSTGLETVERAQSAWPGMPIVVLTGADDEHMGLEAVQHGVQDFLVKGQAQGPLIARALRYAVERRRAQAEILRMNRELEERVSERTTQLRRLALEITLIEQRERRRLAELLHDNLQQLLVFSRLSVGGARALAADPALGQTLERVEKTLSEAIEVARSLTAELSPPALYSHGLTAAVRWFGGRLHAMVGMNVAVIAEEGAEPVLEGHRALLFPCVRELLTNVVKHAGVAEATVRISRCEGSGVRIAVSDEGRGFDSADEQRGRGTGGFGLFGIRERLHQMGGGCEVESAPGHGTKVTLTMPGCVPEVEPGTGNGDQTA